MSAVVSNLSTEDNDSDVCESNEIEEDNNDSGDDEEEVHVPTGLSVKMRPSNFKCIPATVFVDYPNDLKITRDDKAIEEELGNRKLHYTSYWERRCIRNVFSRAGFIKDEGNWTAMWSKHMTDEEMKELNCLQKTNHFSASWCVGRKDRLLSTINEIKRVHGSHFNFHPDGYVLPGDKDALTRYLNSDSTSSKTLWIQKPCASSCAKGIKVVTSQQVQTFMTAKATRKKSYLIQKYLHNPYLIQGKKFDLRIYCLVTGVDPLRVYVFQEGLTRLGTVEYSLSNIKNRFAHLTNYSVNKKSSGFVAADEHNDDPDMEASKWSLTAFKRYLASVESPAIMENTMKKVMDVVAKTMIAAEAEMTLRMRSSASYRTNCFELFGLDIILDTNLDPFLLEVNISPSLMGSSPLDRRIKGSLIADIFHVVGFYPHDPTLLKKVTKTEISLAGRIPEAPPPSGINRRPRCVSAGRVRGATGVVPKERGSSMDRAPPGQIPTSTSEKVTKTSVPRRSQQASSGVASHSLSPVRQPQPIPGKAKTKSTTGSKTTKGSAASSHSSHSNSQPQNPYAGFLEAFGFGSLSQMLNSQDNWRRSPSPANVDFAKLRINSDLPSSSRNCKKGLSSVSCSVWYILLMIEDEFSRAASSQFTLLHPAPATALHYISLFRTPRFSDHVLCKWVMQGCSNGLLKKYIPTKFLYTTVEKDGERGRKIERPKAVPSGHISDSASATTTSSAAATTTKNIDIPRGLSKVEHLRAVVARTDQSQSSSDRS